MYDYEEANRLQRHSETHPSVEPRYRQICRHFPTNPQTVLDIGCNTGRGGRVIKEFFNAATLYGLDCVQERIERIPRDIYADAFYGQATKLPFEDNKMDVVVASEIIEHILPSEVEAVLCEIFRVLKVGGRVLITTPNPGYWRRRVKDMSVLHGIGHVTQHHPAALKMRLLMTGFSKIKLRGDGRIVRYISESLPLINLYSGYLIRADKV